MTQFRSHREMNDVYQERHDKGESGPYILEFSTDNQILTFFGSSHSNDPQDKQWEVLDIQWQTFADHPNPKKILILERQDTDPAGLSREKALKQYSESGLAAWLAAQAGVETQSGEPDRVEEITHLKKTYSVPEIMTYYFSRQMLQWITQDYRVNTDWQDYASDTIKHYTSLNCWDNQNPSLSTALAWFQARTGNKFDPKDRQAVYNLSDPAQSAVSSASGQFRDQTLFEKIKSRWHDGYDVFAVYGSGHAIVLEPALAALTNGVEGDGL